METGATRSAAAGRRADAAPPRDRPRHPRMPPIATMTPGDARADGRARGACARELAEARTQIAQLERLADEDALTPIANRRAFVRELTRMIAFTNRYGVPSSVVYFDVNGMKQINDNHGHPAGDAALRQVAKVLLDNVRSSDIVGPARRRRVRRHPRPYQPGAGQRQGRRAGRGDRRDAAALGRGRHPRQRRARRLFVLRRRRRRTSRSKPPTARCTGKSGATPRRVV